MTVPAHSNPAESGASACCRGSPRAILEWQRRFVAFNHVLQQQGWNEGGNIAFEFRFADANPERLPALAAELVAANVDVIVTNAAQPIEAARKATSTIPIVMASVGDALGAGYVASLAHPGVTSPGLPWSRPVKAPSGCS